VSVALVIQYAELMGHIAICVLSCCTVFFRIDYKLHDFRKKKRYWT